MKRVDKKEVKKGFLKENYTITWRYTKESHPYILIIIFLLFFGAFISLIYQPPEFIEAVKAFIDSVLNETQGFGVIEMIVYILNNNLKNSFFSMILGIIFGIIPIFTALANGYILGFVAEKSVAIDGPSVLLRLVPHGIFEFPAIILALATGTKLGMFWFGPEKKKELIRRLEGSLRVFLFLILPLLIIAAIIEGVLIIALG